MMTIAATYHPLGLAIITCSKFRQLNLMLMLPKLPTSTSTIRILQSILDRRPRFYATSIVSKHPAVHVALAPTLVAISVCHLYQHSLKPLVCLLVFLVRSIFPTVSICGSFRLVAVCVRVFGSNSWSSPDSLFGVFVIFFARGGLLD